MERDLEKEFLVEEIIRDDEDITSLYLNQSGEGDDRTRGDASGEEDEQDNRGDGSGDDCEGEAHDAAEVYIY